jgi:hypothetical protein
LTEGDLPRHVLTDLITRSQKMPQVAVGWRTDYVLFARDGFTAATQSAAKELGVRLVTLSEIEDDLASET